jgi:hypothetical protein
MGKRNKNNDKSIQPIIGYPVINDETYLDISELSNFFQVPDTSIIIGINYKEAFKDVNSDKEDNIIDFDASMKMTKRIVDKDIERITDVNSEGKGNIVYINASPSKMAKTDKDFETIFNREFGKYEFEDNASDRRAFSIWLKDNYLAGLKSKAKQYFKKVSNSPELLGTMYLFIDWLSKKAEKPTKKILTGFQSSLTDKQIEKLYSEMHGSYFEVTPDHFKAMFKSEPLPPDFSIKWNDSLILLAYFIGKNDKIKDNRKWKKTSQIFNTKEYLQQNLNNNPYPKGFENIDRIWQSIENNLP